MSAYDLVQRLTAEAKIGEPLDWPQIWREIDNEHEKAQTTEDRVLLLKLLTALLNSTERQLPPEKLEDFRSTRQQDYRRFLVRECLIGSEVCPETLYAVTEREVEAGRMRADDDFRELAIAGMGNAQYSREDLIELERTRSAEKKNALKESWWKRLYSRIRF